MSAPDEDVEQTARVMPLNALSVVTMPDFVKIVHRNGRVLHTFYGPNMKAEGLALIEELRAVFESDKRLAREVTLKRPWWRWWP